MALFLKQFLLLSSICCLLFTACRISKYKHLKVVSVSEKITEQRIKPIVKNNRTSQKYNTTIDFLNKHFSGLLLVKQTDSITKHLVFVTELGMKMFDFEFKDTTLRIAYIFEPLNKPNLINALSSNLKNSLLTDVFLKEAKTLANKAFTPIYALCKNKQTRYFTVNENAVLVMQDIFEKRKRTSKINYIFDKDTQTYTHIACTQYGFIKLKIELNAITTN